MEMIENFSLYKESAVRIQGHVHIKPYLGWVSRLCKSMSVHNYLKSLTIHQTCYLAYWNKHFEILSSSLTISTVKYPVCHSTHSSITSAFWNANSSNWMTSALPNSHSSVMLALKASCWLLEYLFQMSTKVLQTTARLFFGKWLDNNWIPVIAWNYVLKGITRILALLWVNKPKSGKQRKTLHDSGWDLNCDF